MCSLTDFIETSLGRCGGLVSTATVTGQGASLVDASVRGGDFSWPKTGTFGGHQRGHQLAKNGDFLMATDNGRSRSDSLLGSLDHVGCRSVSYAPTRLHISKSAARSFRGIQSPSLTRPRKANIANDILRVPMPATADIPSHNDEATHPLVMSDRKAPRRYVTGL